MLLQLKIQLEGITEPDVWRKLLVPSHFTFDRLHEVIQEAFGWWNSHLYEFTPTGLGSHPQIGIKDDEWEEDALEDAEEVRLEKYLHTVGQTFTYLYDFGDHWMHIITVEKIVDKNVTSPELLDGKGACPHEDCGGVHGYWHMLQVLSDPENEEYEEMRQWLDLGEEEEWDVNRFDLDEVKKKVSYS